MKKIVDENVVDYIEGLFFKQRSLELILRTIAIPSKYIKIDEEVRQHYLDEYTQAFTEWQVSMQELKSMVFPDSPAGKTIYLDFNTKIAELVDENQTCESCDQ